MNKDELEFANKLVDRYMAWKGKKNLYYLCKFILGFEDLTWYFHKPICKKVQRVNKWVATRKEVKHIPKKIRYRLWLLPRGHFKTTILDIGHIIQLILVDPDIRICLAYNKLDNAKETMKVIKDVFMSNDLFRRLYPEYCPKPNREGNVNFGTTTQFTVPNRVSQTLREGTVECAGVDSGITSRHYDYMKKDDLVDEKSVTNDEQLQASKDWDRLSISLFDTPERCFTDWSGTRYDDRDLYGDILKRRDIFVLKMSAIVVVDGEELTIFPDRFSLDGLQEIRQDQGSYIFNCQYMMDPVPKDEQEFKDVWMDKCYYRKKEFPAAYNIYIQVDPASRRKKKNDWTVILVHAVDTHGDWWLVDGIRDKLSPTKRVNALFKLASCWKSRLRKVTYESIGFQESDVVYAKKKMQEEQFFFTIKTIDSQDKAKDWRIRSLIPRYEYTKIRLPRDGIHYFCTFSKKRMNLVESLRYEADRFPKAEHKDVLDAQAQLNQISVLKAVDADNVEEKIKRNPEKVPGSFMWHRMKIIQMKKQADKVEVPRDYQSEYSSYV